MIRDFSITHTTPADIDSICNLFDAAIEFQRKHNYPVWAKFEGEVLMNFIEEQLQYKITIDNEIAMIFNADYSDKVTWREYDQGNAVYLHHIVVNPKHKGQKLLGLVIDWAIQHATEKQLPYVRLDTWGSNTALIDYYIGFGFRFVEFFKTPDIPEIQPYYRGLELALLERKA
jgi:ribosomal protein S18 acetylase RimI-like enzyme